MIYVKLPDPLQCQIIEKNFDNSNAFLKDEDYSKALNFMVIACVDIIFTNDKQQMLLGLRSRYPFPDYWMIGGRMLPGETFEKAAQRKASEEIRLDLATDRFDFIGILNNAWAIRHQAPKTKGVHAVSTIMTAKLTTSEIEHIKLTSEYLEFRWIDISLMASSRHHYHSALTIYAATLQRAINQKLPLFTTTEYKSF